MRIVSGSLTLATIPASLSDVPDTIVQHLRVSYRRTGGTNQPVAIVGDSGVSASPLRGIQLSNGERETLTGDLPVDLNGIYAMLSTASDGGVCTLGWSALVP